MAEVVDHARLGMSRSTGSFSQQVSIKFEETLRLRQTVGIGGARLDDGCQQAGRSGGDGISMAISVNVGDQFEETRDTPMGVLRRHWVVVSTQGDAIPHATLRDPTGSLADKSLSVVALANSRWFRPLQPDQRAR